MNRSTVVRFGCCALLCLWSVGLARPGVIKTTTGATYRGDIREIDGDKFVITVDKVDTTINKADVGSLQYLGTLDEQFDQRMSALPLKDANGRVLLARFAFDHGRNDLAIQALASAMQIDPKNPDAIEMLKTVNAQQALQAEKASGKSATGAVSPPATAPASQPARHLLTAADINTIRQAELKNGEVVPFAIAPEMRRKFLTESGVSPVAFAQAPMGEQLGLLLSHGSPEVKMATRIMRDPASIATFKRTISPAVLRNCATIGCHGGTDAGALVLFTGTDDESVYTNFYIMEQFSQTQKGDGTLFGGATQRKLIDRGSGAHSLLVNFGLPASVAEIAHPPITTGASVTFFRSRNGAVYDQFIDWMDQGLNLIEPTYGIKYAIPHGKAPASQPMKRPG